MSSKAKDINKDKDRGGQGEGLGSGVNGSGRGGNDRVMREEKNDVVMTCWGSDRCCSNNGQCLTS